MQGGSKVVGKTANFARMCKESAAASSSKSNSTKGSSNSKVRAQPALVNMIYHHRQRTMHHLVGTASTVSPQQLLLLGAGLDSSYNAHFNDIYHVDFENIISDYDLSKAHCNNSNSSDHQVHLVAADLCGDLSKLRISLEKDGFRPDVGCVVLIECVLCYMPTDRVVRLLQWLNGYLQRAILITYDPIAPRQQRSDSLDWLLKPSSASTNESVSEADYKTFGGVLRAGFAKQGCPIRTCMGSAFEYSCLLRLGGGWRHACTYTMEQAVACGGLLLPPPPAPSSETAEDPSAERVPIDFDEFASEVQLNQHYVVSYSSSDHATCAAFADRLHERKTEAVQSIRDREMQLHFRMEVLSARLKALEAGMYYGGCVGTSSSGDKAIFAKAHALTGGSGGLVVVEDGPSSTQFEEVEAVTRVYLECFRPVMERYASVAKFCTAAAKDMRKAKWNYNSNVKFWVASVNVAERDSVTGNISNKRQIAGCVCLKIKQEAAKPAGPAAALSGNYAKSNKKPEHSGDATVQHDGSAVVEEGVAMKEAEGPAPDQRGKKGRAAVVGEISHMSVLPAFRRCGIAKLLLARAMNHMRAEFCMNSQSANSSSNGGDDDDVGEGSSSAFDGASVGAPVHKSKKEPPAVRVDLSTVADFEAARSLYLAEGFAVKREEVLEGDGCRLIYMSIDL